MGEFFWSRATARLTLREMQGKNRWDFRPLVSHCRGSFLSRVKGERNFSGLNEPVIRTNRKHILTLYYILYIWFNAFLQSLVRKKKNKKDMSLDHERFPKTISSVFPSFPWQGGHCHQRRDVRSGTNSAITRVLLLSTMRPPLLSFFLFSPLSTNLTRRRFFDSLLFFHAFFWTNETK